MLVCLGALSPACTDGSCPEALTACAGAAKVAALQALSQKSREQADLARRQRAEAEQAAYDALVSLADTARRVGLSS